MYPGGTIIQCENLIANAGHEASAYYQMESPPCYTIATGLPTYDEALHHHQHYAFGMQFMYPSIAAVHHQQQQAMLNANCNAVNVISNWEKEDLTLKQRKEKLQQLHQQQQYEIVEEKPKCLQLPTFEMVAAATTTLPPPPVYNEAAVTDDITASVALLSPNSTLVFNDKEASISICVDAMDDDDATKITTRASGDFINVTGNNVFIA